MATQDPNKVDDGRLLERMRRGNEAAFSELFARHQGPIYRYALHMCGPGEADDVVQDTFLALIRQTEAVEGRGFDSARGTVGAYLFGIARHHVLKHFGLRTADCGLIDDLTDSNPHSAIRDPQSKSPLAELERTEAIALVREAVRSLPLVYREVIVLCELQEMDYADAAALLECPIGTVRSRLHRARALLTRKLTTMRETVHVE
jgi:RNA polymerase sigma-70 factor (ECF subfamily)